MQTPVGVFERGKIGSRLIYGYFESAFLLRLSDTMRSYSRLAIFEVDGEPCD